MNSPNEPSGKALAVHRRLLDFFGFPKWRQPLPPLDEMVLTILSQNTNDANRDRAFEALRARFQTWEQVRDADLEDVIGAIRPAGLANQKAPRIQDILREITAERGTLSLDFLKDMPPEQSRQRLMKFKGIGPKTAAIVMQFSLGKPAFPVDTHIHRVTRRIGLIPPKLSAERAHEQLAKYFPSDEFGPAHLNLIRLGREICHPRNPECPRCPVNNLCDYFHSNNP